MLRNLDASSGRYEPFGWMHWPDNQDYGLQFMRILGAAQEGASTISECFLTATRITPGDDESWYREWKKIGQTSRVRGDIAFQRGHTETAKSNWLRASNYFRSAELFLNSKTLGVSHFLTKWRFAPIYISRTSTLPASLFKFPLKTLSCTDIFFARQVRHPRPPSFSALAD